MVYSFASSTAITAGGGGVQMEATNLSFRVGQSMTESSH